MANSGPHSAGSQFFITFRPTPRLDGKHVAFGHVAEGHEVLAALEAVGSYSGTPLRPVTVADCGQLL